jgi:glycosyltransferase involved in cell wall biosynthesis
MMASKPELIMFSQNLLGGGTSFQRNMLTCFPTDFFDIKCIYFDPLNWNGAKALDITLNANDTVFSYGNDPIKTTAKNLSKLISNTEGSIVSNLETELISLDLYKRSKKTIFFVCHDDGFIPLAIKYKSIIDVYISHNISVHQELLKLLSNENKDIYFIQHGVNIPEIKKTHNTGSKLKIVFLARHYIFKGIYDLPVINELLEKKGINVEWTILGDGPERNGIIKKVEHLPNFHFNIPQTSADVIAILKDQDVFILPSRADGLPVALLESMSVGCVPVIANFSEGIKKVVTEDIGFVVPVGENETFAEKIALLSQDRTRLTVLSENCIEKVKREFDIKEQALKYYNLYKKYKELKKRRKIRFSDLSRKMRYYSFINKLEHFLKSGK